MNTISAVIEGKNRVIATLPHERAGAFADVCAIASGAASGAMLGSTVPVIGTTVGAIGGGILGTLGGK